MKSVSLFLFLLLLQVSTSAWSFPDTGESEIIAFGLEEANRIRASEGLPELQLDSALQEAAQLHAEDMKARNYFSHTNPEGLSPFDRMRSAGVVYRAAAENIAYGTNSAGKAFTLWMNSEGHRKNLLNPKYHRQGLGFRDGRWVHDLTD